MSSNTERIQWLDVLRGAAILLVLLFHFTVRYENKYPLNVFEDVLSIKMTKIVPENRVLWAGFFT